MPPLLHRTLFAFYNRKKEKRTQELWWQGVPPNVRPKLWPVAIGNTLHVTKDLFVIMMKQAQTRVLLEQQILLQQRIQQAGTAADSGLDVHKTSPPKDDDTPLGKVKTAELIPLDLPRTFPALQFFQPGGPSHHYLKNVLEAYVCYRPDIGYVRTMAASRSVRCGKWFFDFLFLKKRVTRCSSARRYKACPTWQLCCCYIWTSFPRSQRCATC